MINQQALRDGARRAGFGEVTPSQLKRLRRAGLLQPPAQQHSIGQLGSHTLYPPEALPQLLAVLAIRRDRRQRPFEAIRFLGWEQGLWVEHTELRSTITHWVRESVKDVQGLRRSGDAEAEADRRALKLGAAASTSSHPIAAEIRGRIHKEELSMPDVFLGIIQVAERLEDASYAAETLGTATGFDETASPYDMAASLPEAYGSHKPPPASQWPRIISRAGRTRIAIGYAYLTLVKQLVEAEVLPAQPLLHDDTNRGIRYRAVIAAKGIVLGLPFAQKLAKSMTGEDL